MTRRREEPRRGGGRAERPPMRVLPMLGLSLVLLVAGWTGLWLFARHEAGAAFARWRLAEQGFGRTWQCPDERIGGFPFGIVLSCDHPTFEGPVADGVFRGGIVGLKADAPLYFPTNVVVTLTGPLAMAEVDGPRRADAAWTDGTLTLRGVLPGDIDRGQLELSGLVLGIADDPLGRIERLTLGFKPGNRDAAGRMDIDVSTNLVDARIPALDAALGTTDPMNLRFGGFATQVLFAGGVTLSELLEPWAAAGGQVHVQSLEIYKGGFRTSAVGRLGLDEEHRPQGRLDAGFSGLGPVAARLGIPMGAVKMGGLLSGLLGGGAAAPAPGNAAPAELTLPIVAKDGRLKLGPVDTGLRLAPVY